MDKPDRNMDNMNRLFGIEREKVMRLRAENRRLREALEWIEFNEPPGSVAKAKAITALSATNPAATDPADRERGGQ